MILDKLPFLVLISHDARADGDKSLNLPLASWLIKTRKSNLSKIISSLNQQYVFNRQKKPSYARKMKTVMNIVRKRLGKKKDGKS